MRSSLACLFLLAAACDGGEMFVGPGFGDSQPLVSESGLLMSTSTQSMTFESVAVTDDGGTLFADVGGGTWCTFRTADGYMSADTSLSDPDIDVQDHQGSSTLVTTSRGLSRVDANGEMERYWAPGAKVENARLRAVGAVAYTTEEMLLWKGPYGNQEEYLPGCHDLTMDRAGDTAFLACADGVIAATQGGSTQIGPATTATRVAWSDSAAALLVLGGDRQTLRGLTAEGDELWSFTSDSTVLTVAAPGDVPYFTALVQDGDATTLELISADSGDVVDRLAVDGTNLRASHDAAVVAVYGGWYSYALSVMER